MTSAFPVSVSGQETQRTRWETGHLNIIREHVPKLLLKGMRRADLDLVVTAADAAIPPLSLLVLSLTATVFGAAIIAIIGGTLAPLTIAAIACLMLAAAICLAAVKMRATSNLIKIVVLVPAYVASKLAIYAGAAAGKPIEWIRSKRD